SSPRGCRRPPDRGSGARLPRLRVPVGRPHVVPHRAQSRTCHEGAQQMTTADVLADAAECAPTGVHAIGTEAAAAVASMLKSLADPLRLRMLSAIAADPRGEACVCDLAELADVSQPTISHHLKVLRESGLLAS